MWYVEVVRCEFVNYRKRSIRNIQPKASKDYSSHREKDSFKNFVVLEKQDNIQKSEKREF